MAEQLPLNTFKSVTVNLTTTTETVYAVPINVTAIILGTHVANKSESAVGITANLFKASGQYNVIHKFDVPSNDAASITNGKLIMESGTRLVASASANDSLDLIISLLETSNV